MRNPENLSSKKKVRKWMQSGKGDRKIQRFENKRKRKGKEKDLLKNMTVKLSLQSWKSKLGIFLFPFSKEKNLNEIIKLLNFSSQLTIPGLTRCTHSFPILTEHHILF